MRFLKALLVAFTLSAAFVAAAPTPASAQATRSLGGVWQGVFWNDNTAPVRFQVTLVQNADGRLTGSIVEPNTFSPAPVQLLLSMVDGEVSGRNVRFRKTYDGTGGVAHAVVYHGTVHSDRRITGEWIVEGGAGLFELGR